MGANPERETVDPAKWGENRTNPTSAKDALKLARAMLRLEKEMKLMRNELNELMSRQTALTEVAYLMAGYEKQSDGSYHAIKEAEEQTR